MKAQKKRKNRQKLEVFVKSDFKFNNVDHWSNALLTDSYAS